MKPEPIAFVLIVLGLVAPEAQLIFLQVVACLFGATAALALPALGGATIAPAALLLPFLLVRALRTRGMQWFVREVPRAGVWLGLLTLWGLLSAVILPRAFAGSTQIMTVDRSSSANLQVVLQPLRPVSGNITQSAYLMGGLLTFLAARALLFNRRHLGWFRDAVLLLSALNVLAALWNIAEFWLGFPKVLQYLRTASYAMFDSYEEAGLVRIQGTFPETSAFSAFTLPLFAFTANCWLGRKRQLVSGALALASLVLLLASTSGTAYTGLGLYVAAWCLVLGSRGISRRFALATPLFVIGALLGIAVTYVLCFEPGVVSTVATFFEHTVWNKLQSQSGIERSSWNRQAWQNFLDTAGIGVGLGSARASSFVLVLLSNLGVIGLVTFAGFLFEVVRSGRGSRQDPAISAARHAVFASLITAMMAGTVLDLGILFYVFAAAATSLNAEELWLQSQQQFGTNEILGGPELSG